MLGLAPLAGTPLSDDGDRLSLGQARMTGGIAFESDTAAHTSIGGKANPSAVFSLGGSAAGNGSYIGHGLGDLTAAGHADAIGTTSAIAAGTFNTINGAVAASRSVGSIHGGIEVRGQSFDRAEVTGALQALWRGQGHLAAGLETRATSNGSLDLTLLGKARTGGLGGVYSVLEVDSGATARSASLAAGLGHLEASGIAQTSVTLHLAAAGSISLVRAVGADVVVEGATTPGMALTGSSECGSRVSGISVGGLGLGGHAALSAISDARLHGRCVLAGSGNVAALNTGRSIAFGPVLSGCASATLLNLRSARSVGHLDVSVGATAAVATHATAVAVAASGLEAVGTVRSLGAVSGRLSLLRALDAGVLGSGVANRQISLAGTVSAVAMTTADGAAAGLALTGTSAGQGAGIGSARLEPVISGGVEIASSISGGATTVLTWVGASGAATGSGAGVVAEASLQGETTTTNSIHAIARTSFGLSSSSKGAVRSAARLRGQLDVAGEGSADVSSLGRTRGVIDVARDFAGDVDVLGNSTPALAVVGRATLQSTAIGTVASAGVNLAGSTNATNASDTHAQTLGVLAGNATAQGKATASSHPLLELSLFVDGRSPLIAKSIAPWSTVGQMAATLALAGSVETVLPIATGALTHTGITATATVAITLSGASTAQLAAVGPSSDTFRIGRASDTIVVIDAGASRPLGVQGYSQGQISIAADPRPFHLRLDMQAGAAAVAAGKASTDNTTAGSAASQAKSRASGQGRLTVNRSGSGDVLVLSGALRGISLLGASAARSTGLAAANSIVAPSLSASVSNVVQLDFQAEAIAPDGGGLGSNLVKVPDISAPWDLHTKAIAYRAPPALRRSESAKYGLSGRLTPSNSGLVLRG